MSDGGADPLLRTLATQNPDAAMDTTARHVAYQRKFGKTMDKRSKDVFLSGVGEMEVDIDYRFTITVMGSAAESIIEAVCSSPAARRFGGMIPKVPGRPNLYSCLCEVSSPDLAESQQPRMAKLAFHAVGFNGEAPVSKTRQEALSSAIVYALDIHNKDGEPTFLEQLDALQNAVSRLREQVRAKLRPVKALLLYSSESEGGQRKSQHEPWAAQLADHEHSHGDTWKFGPVALGNDDTLHSVFAEICSARIVHCGDGLPDDKEEVANGGDEEATFVPSAGMAVWRTAMRASEASIRSEQELPPMFEAEESGDECPDDALEKHERVFGLNEGSR